MVSRKSIMITGGSRTNQSRHGWNGCHDLRWVKVPLLTVTFSYAWISNYINIRALTSAMAYLTHPASAAYMPQWIISALVQIMAWRRIGDKSLSEPMLKWFTEAYMRLRFLHRFLRWVFFCQRSYCWLWKSPECNQDSRFLRRYKRIFLISSCGPLWYLQQIKNVKYSKIYRVW